MTEKTFTLSQPLDYLGNLEVSSDSEEESLGDLQSAKIYLQEQIQVILAVINFLVLLYWK